MTTNSVGGGGVGRETDELIKRNQFSTTANDNYRQRTADCKTGLRKVSVTACTCTQVNDEWFCCTALDALSVMGLGGEGWGWNRGWGGGGG